MKRTFQIGSGIFGEGRTKICVPIVEVSQKEIWEKAQEIAGLPVDIVEWRGDFYEDILRTDRVLATLEGLKSRLSEKALLFTFRTSKEGGNCPIQEDYYYSLNLEVAASGCAELIDMEAFLNEERTAGEIQKIHEVRGRVITSSHDFLKTPSVEEMVRRLLRMEKLGADAAKLAVMPANRQDVLNLLQAAVTAEEVLRIPAVTMSMGSLGVISRLSGALTGSAMTFAAAGKLSAPGQIPVEQTADFLRLLEA